MWRIEIYIQNYTKPFEFILLNNILLSFMQRRYMMNKTEPFPHPAKIKFCKACILLTAIK